MIRITVSHLFSAALFAQLALGSGCESSGESAVAQEQAAPTGDVVELSAEAIARNDIRVAKVVSHAIGDIIEAPAELHLNPDRVAHVAPLVPGRLQSVAVSIGEHVKKGQRLAVLRSVELGRARADYRRAKAVLAVTRANFTRQKKLRADGIASERSFLAAKLRQAEAVADSDAARARLLVFGLRGGAGPDMTMVAPIAGTIIERHATQGENVGTDDALFIIADTAQVWVVARVYEQDMPRVHVGATARLTLQAQPERSWDGRLSFVAPVVDEATRTLAVRTELDNKDGSLRPGLFGRMTIDVGKVRAVAAIPRVAVQTLRGETVVFVPTGRPNAFRAQNVTAGRRRGDLVEIREGLPIGSQVVVAGAFLLKSQLMAGEFAEED